MDGEMDDDEMAFLQGQDEEGMWDADEEEMMYMMEQEESDDPSSRHDTHTQTPQTQTQTQTQVGAADEDLEWLAQAGATQPTQPDPRPGPAREGQANGRTEAGTGAGEDVVTGDDHAADEDPIHQPGAGSIFGAPQPVESRARSEAPKLDATTVTGHAVAVTAADGRRAFVRLDDGQHAASTPTTGASGASFFPGGAGQKRTSLLSQPIDALLESIDAARHAEVLAEAQRMDEAHRAERSGGSGGASAPPARPGPGRKLGAADSATLWVDAYAPKAFSDLLSHEHVNREVLHWLKAWDGVVFKRAPPKPAADVRFRSGGRGGGPTGASGAPGGRHTAGGASGAPGGRVGGPTTHVPLDADGRPQHKILLLCGPPGVGKTTLAHVAAAHAGYRVVEVNASDERSADALKARVLDATQMQALTVLKDRRPNCVVIDEIDGALGGAEGRSAIQALLSVVNGGGRGRRPGVTRAGEDQGGPNDVESGGRAKKKGPGPLMRPIIAVCNDLYAPALRPLREVAKVFHMAAPASARLNSRLRDVCAKQGLRADIRALGALADREENDVRACLNTLQVLARDGRELTLADVGPGGVAGEKDLTVQARGVWEALLSGHIANARTRKATREAHNNALYAQCQSLGDNELLMAGLFENMHSVRFQDGSMGKTVRALQAVGDADVMLGAAYRRGQHFLEPYVTSAAMAVHACVSHAPAAGYLEWPQGGKVAREATRSRRMLKGWAASAKAATNLAAAPEEVLVDVVPHLLTAVAPEVRPVAANFLKPHEAEAMRTAVDTMVSHGLSFVPPPAGGPDDPSSFIAAFARTAGGPALVLDPPLDHLVRFGGGVKGVTTGVRTGGQPWKHRPGSSNPAGGSIDRAPTPSHPPLKGPDRRVLPANVRQMLAHEVRVEEIRRAEAAVHGDGPDTPPTKERTNPGGGPPGCSKEATKEAKEAAAKRLATALGGVGGRGGMNKKARKASGDAPAVTYKFNEGYTNAVRRVVYMRDLA